MGGGRAGEGGRGWGMRAGGDGVGVNYNNLSKVSNKLILPEPQLQFLTQK